MVKEAMECEVTEVHTDTVARLKDTLLSQEQFQNLGTLFKMFSDPTRLKILSALFQEELCVCDLSELLEMTHSAVSHQLSVRRQNRLIKYNTNDYMPDIGLLQGRTSDQDRRNSRKCHVTRCSIQLIHTDSLCVDHNSYGAADCG